MDIKVGDIVEYSGVRQRVMGIYRDGTVLYDDMFGPRAQLRIEDVVYSFYLYCVEKVNNYDMI